ncbi:MAG: radical SAM family heme chaperone HemW [Pirellulales bacterium]
MTAAATIAAVDAPPRAVYIHVPFCRHHCGYCNFTVVAGRDDLVPAYLDAIERELSWLETPREVDTLYFGGGTPTRLAIDDFSRLVRTVRNWHPLAAGNEWTVEANPADLSAGLVEALVQFGVTRLSIGGQSFRVEKLKLLERDHAPEAIAESVRLARGAGLDVSLDMIFATPGETLADWQRDLGEAIELAPEHISAYGLTFERGTTFWNRREKRDLVESDEELQREMYEWTIDELSSAGFEHYEVSNFARPGKRSRHNENYWSGGGYYAAGPGAARYVDGMRETNHRSTTTYLKHVLAGESPVAERERLNPEQRARERLIFGLRRLEGVHRAAFQSATGFEIDQLAGRELRRYVQMGLLQDDGHRVCLTRDGLLVSDAMWPELL